MPFGVDLAAGAMLDILGLTLVAVSILVQNVGPFVAWVTLWFAIDLLAPLKPNLGDAITKRELKRRRAA